MRLISATVRRYRVHGDTRVELVPGLNLITGSNESGKSTLVEAIHRVLFLRARGHTDVHEQMRSTLYPGTPEVILEFEQTGKTCRLTKQFTHGAILSIAGEPDRRDDEAEQRLAGLLRSGDAIQGRGAEDRLAARWAHLWAWQGRSGAAPGDTAREQNVELVRRLQELGGGAVVSSPLDSRLLAHFRAQAAEVFTDSRRYRATSPAGQAEAALQQAEAAREEAVKRLGATEEYASRYEGATHFLADAEPQAQGLEAELQRLEERRQQVRVLTEQRTTADREREAAAKEVEHLKKANQAIANARIRIDDTQAGSEEATEVAKQAKQRAKTARETADRLLSELQPKREALTRAQSQVEACAAVLEQIDRKARLVELESSLTEVTRLESRRNEYQNSLAACRQLSRKDVDALHRLSRGLSQAETELRAMSARLDVLKAEVPVTVDGKPLAVGTSMTATDAVEIHAGDAVVLRLLPGGGKSLAEAKASVDSAQCELRDALLGLGVESVDAADAALTQVSTMQAELKAVVNTLKALNAEDVKTRHREAVEALKTATLRLEVLRSDTPGFSPAVTRDTAVATLEKARAAERQSRQACTDAEQELEAQNASAGALEETARQQAAAITARQNERAAAEGTLRGLIEAHGDDAARAARTEQCTRTLDAAAAEARGLAEHLTALQPELLERDAKRLERSLNDLRTEINTKRTDQQVALSHLQSVGASDPRAEEALARQHCDRAEARFRELATQAQATRHLADLFEEEQARASAAIAAPLNQRVSEYIRCVYGPEADAAFTIGPDGTLGQLVVSRQGPGPRNVPFDALSSGTREQVGVAVRLAMAEVLAANHGGCLPVVLDDAFANSDPDRVRELQRMLDLAASRGLQVIVLTCNPNDYRALGAAMTHELKRPIMQSPGPQPAPSTPGVSTPADGSAGRYAQTEEPEVGAGTGTAPGSVQAGAEAVLRFVRGQSGVTRGEVAAALGLDDQTASRLLRELLDAGQIRKEGQRHGTRYFGVP